VGNITVKQHFDALLRERDKRHRQRDALMGRAIETALASLNKRLDLLNELRGNVATREQLDAVTLRMTDLKSTLDLLAGANTGKDKTWAVIVSATVVAGVLFGIAGFFLAHLGASS